MAQSSMAGVRYSTGIADIGGWRSPARRSGPELPSGRSSRSPAGQASQGRLVDQPGSPCQAWLITSRSAKSPKALAKCSRSPVLTGPPEAAPDLLLLAISDVTDVPACGRRSLLPTARETLPGRLSPTAVILAR